jgi:protein N-lysine methyltransferase METTL21A
MVNIMSANIDLNCTVSRIEACELDWYYYPHFQANNRAGPVPEHLISPDIILAADCVYFEPAFPLLQETLRKLTDRRSVEVYMAYKKRRKVKELYLLY